MATPTWNGYAHMALAGGLLVVTTVAYIISRRGWLGPVGILFLLAFHPAWTIERGQERDFSKREAGTAASVLAGAVVVGQFLWIAWAARPRITSQQANDYGENQFS